MNEKLYKLKREVIIVVVIVYKSTYYIWHLQTFSVYSLTFPIFLLAFAAEKYSVRNNAERMSRFRYPVDTARFGVFVKTARLMLTSQAWCLKRLSLDRLLRQGGRLLCSPFPEWWGSSGNDWRYDPLNQADAIVFFLIDDFCVNLRCLHLGMAKQFGNRVDVGSLIPLNLMFFMRFRGVVECFSSKSHSFYEI